MNVPDGWKNVVLGDLMEFKNGLNTDKENYGRGIKFLIRKILQLAEANVLGEAR